MRPIRLGLSTPVWLDDPTNLIQIVLHGIAPPVARPDVSMPPFADVLTDKQVADLVAYIRKHFTDKPAWNDVAGTVSQIRDEGARGASGAREVASQGQAQ